MLRVQAQDSIGSIVIGCRDGGKGGGVIFMSLLFFNVSEHSRHFWHKRSALQSVAVQAVDWQRR